MAEITPPRIKKNDMSLSSNLVAQADEPESQEEEENHKRDEEEIHTDGLSAHAYWSIVRLLASRRCQKSALVHQEVIKIGSSRCEAANRRE